MNLQSWDQDALEPLQLLVVDDDVVVRDVLVRQLMLDGHFTNILAKPYNTRQLVNHSGNSREKSITAAV